jgi:hypothetical protein
MQSDEHCNMMPDYVPVDDDWGDRILMQDPVS